MPDNPGLEQGYVYILEVKDINLPVCKIGRTARTPELRCEEINNSSTGDFLWEVAHFVYSNDCKGLEALVHSKLDPLRQKRREFFNLRADDAFLALQSIIDAQSNIRIVDAPAADPVEAKKVKQNSREATAASGRHLDPRYAEYLHLFTSVLNIKGRPFGQFDKPKFGMSDGNSGTQWNLTLTVGDDEAHLGVNLEGLKYTNWPIATLLLSELEHPSLETLKSQMDDPGEVFIRFTRDSWQITRRPDIEEQFIGGEIISLAEIGNWKWVQMVREGLTCLDSAKSYRGRAKQWVTLKKQPKKGDRRRLMDVSPHLAILCKVRLGAAFEEDLKRKLEVMKPAYNWMRELAET